MDSEKMRKFIDHMRAAGQTDEMIAQSLIDAGNNKLAVLNMLGVSSVEELNDRSLAGLNPAAHVDTRGSVHPIVDDKGNIAFKIVPVSNVEATDAETSQPNASPALPENEDTAPDLAADAPKSKLIRPISGQMRSTGVHSGMRSSSRFMRPLEKPEAPSPTITPLHVPEESATTPPVIDEATPPMTPGESSADTSGDTGSVPDSAEHADTPANNNAHTTEALPEHQIIAERSPIAATSIHGQARPPERKFTIEQPASETTESPDADTPLDDNLLDELEESAAEAETPAQTPELNPYDETLHMLAEHLELDPEYLDHPETIHEHPAVDAPADTVTQPELATPTTAQVPEVTAEEIMDLEPIKRLEPIKMPPKPMPRPPIEQVPLPQEIEVTELEAIDGPAHNLRQVAKDAEKEMDELNNTMPYAIPDTPDISKLGDAARTIRESNGLKTVLLLVLVLSLLVLASSIGYRIYYVGL